MYLRGSPPWAESLGIMVQLNKPCCIMKEQQEGKVMIC